MPKTPQKSVQHPFTCVLCLDHQPCRKYRFCDVKCRTNDMLVKLATLFGEATDDLEVHVDAGICHTCFLKVDKFASFRESGKKSLSCYRQTIKSETSMKRLLSLSPEATKTSTQLETVTHTTRDPSKKCRQQLKFTAPTTVPPVTANKPPQLSQTKTPTAREPSKKCREQLKFTTPTNVHPVTADKPSHMSQLPDAIPLTSHQGCTVEANNEEKQEVASRLQFIKDTGLQWLPTSKNSEVTRLAFLKKIYNEASQLCLREPKSVLWAQRSMDILRENKKFLKQILQEMKER